MRAQLQRDLPESLVWSSSSAWRSSAHCSAAFLINMLALATPLFTMSVYDRYPERRHSLADCAIDRNGFGHRVRLVLRTVRSRMIDVTGKTVDVVLAANIFEHVMAVKMAQRPASVGIIANQLATLIRFVSSSLPAAWYPRRLAFLPSLHWRAFTIAGPLAWIPLVMLPIMIALGLTMQRPLIAP